MPFALKIGRGEQFQRCYHNTKSSMAITSHPDGKEYKLHDLAQAQEWIFAF